MKRVGVAGLILMLSACAGMDDSAVTLIDGQWGYKPATAEQTPDELQQEGFSLLSEEERLNLERVVPGGEGFVWLRYVFDAPEGLVAGNAVPDSAGVESGSALAGVYLGRITMADETFINGYPVGRTGSFPPDVFSEWNTYRHYTVASRVLDRSDNTLLVRVYVGHEGALVDTPVIGNPEYTEALWRRNTFIATYLNMAIALVLLVVALYHLQLYRRRRHERENLYFGLLNFFGAIYLSNFFVTFLPGYEVWTGSYTMFQRVVANASVYIIAFFTVAFVRRFLGRREPKVLTALVVVLCLTPIVMSFVLPDYESLYRYRGVMLSTLIPIFFYLVFMLLHSVWKRNENAGLLLVGVSFLLVAALADIVLHNYAQFTHLPYLGGFGFPLMVVFFLFILARRFAAARTEAEDLNINLEQKVETRTKQLRESNEELEQALSKLEAAQEIAERDMQMAVRVQQAFYPPASPQLPPWETGLVFEPASGVSGDVYDFFTRNGSLQGAALFDVSGHGISAGLVAMLAKAVIGRNVARKEVMPLGHVVKDINTELIAEKGNIDNYLTGILARMDAESILFVNAGHTAPLVRSAHNGQVHRIGDASSRGTLVGVPGLPVSYPAMRMRPSPGDVLVLYTDGLTERMNARRQEFGNARLEAALAAAPDSSAQEIAEHLVREAVRFGNDENAATTVEDSVGETVEEKRVEEAVGRRGNRPAGDRDDMTVIVFRYTGGARS